MESILTQYLDSQGINYDVAEYCQMSGIPTLVIINEPKEKLIGIDFEIKKYLSDIKSITDYVFKEEVVGFENTSKKRERNKNKRKIT